MSINGVKPDLTKDQISALMDSIIEKNVFETKSGILTQYLLLKAIQQE